MVRSKSNLSCATERWIRAGEHPLRRQTLSAEDKQLFDRVISQPLRLASVKASLKLIVTGIENQPDHPTEPKKEKDTD